MRFATAPGYTDADQFFTYLRDSLDVLHAEGVAGAPRMFSIGLHCRLIGRPGKIAGLMRFLDHAQTLPGIWFATRSQIAAHWSKTHPHTRRERPSQMSRDRFVDRFGAVFEHSPWIADRAHGLELGPAHDSAIGIHSALCRIFRSASHDERLGVLTAHPDLAGKLAQARRLTPDSAAEQASAALDALTDGERADFQRLNAAYMARHGFPFVIAVRDNTRDTILAAFHARLAHDTETEFATTCAQVERIALLRLKDMMP